MHEQHGESSVRQRLMDSAVLLFTTRGYAATSVREIVEIAGVTKPALYYHFDSKDAILRALVGTMLDQVAELVEWARAQHLTQELRREVLIRWADVVQAHGLALCRFAVANRKVVEGIRPAGEGGAHLLTELYRVLTPAGASIEDQLRVRLALMSINMAGFTATGIDAADGEILEAARRISIGLLPQDL